MHVQSFSFLTAALILIALVACSPVEESSSVNYEQEHDGNLSHQEPRSVIITSDQSKQEITGTENPKLIFSQDFKENLTQSIYPQDVLIIQYDPKRITECKVEGRNFLRYITGFYQVDDQDIQTFEYIPSYTTAQKI